jgi:sulfotransferase family protein
MSNPGRSNIEQGATSPSGVPRDPRHPGEGSGSERRRSGSLASGDVNRIAIPEHLNELPPPLFILAPPRSFTSVVCAMLGQHPQMYGLPETHLFSYETLGAWAESAAQASYPMGHGLLRAVAELYFGVQNELTIRKARQWVRLRSNLTTDFIFKILADRVFPLIPVDKSPSTVSRPKALNRVRSMFPEARFLHLLRHPRGQGESVMKFIIERAKHGPVPPSHWLLQIASYPPAQADAESRPDAPLDPQNGWYAINKKICGLLNMVPADQQMRVRGEDLLAEPDEVLSRIATWMGLRSDAAAIEEMKHPERSPYAFLGPPGARYGNDAFFLQDPAFRPRRSALHYLEGPLSWRNDGQGFSPEVMRLAQEFGYE